MLAADRSEVTLLGLLDLSAACDTVDHKILLDRLHVTFGLRGQVLDWIHSFVTNRTQSISFSWIKSIWLAILCGVPRGSVHYAADVIAIAQRHGFQVHSYADDTQLYFHDKAESCERRLPRFMDCIAAIESWMTANQLKMNTDKKNFIWLGCKHHLAKNPV